MHIYNWGLPSLALFFLCSVDGLKVFCGDSAFLKMFVYLAIGILGSVIFLVIIICSEV